MSSDPPEIFREKISMVTEISTDLDLLGIIEFQIHRLILPILQVNLGKKLEKTVVVVFARGDILI